jgi:propanediol dehydratase small subunit
MNNESVVSNYPLAEKWHKRLRTPSGIPFDNITLDAVLDGRVRMDELRITAEALELQAQIAEACGRLRLADNFRRAAELVLVPQEKILEIYHALRPGRATKAALLALAEELENRWHADRCASFIREAAAVSTTRKADRPPPLRRISPRL